MAFNLNNPRVTRYGTSVTAGYARISGINFNEDGTQRFDVDFYVNQAAFDNGDSPIDSQQYNNIPVTAGTLNTLQAALIANSDVNP